MAVTTTQGHQQNTFITKALDTTICIYAPIFFIELAKNTLSGWSFKSIQPNSTEIDISISYQNKVYCLDSVILNKNKNFNDLLDALNEFFLLLSYLIAGRNKTLKLIHCASYQEDGTNIILLGEKHSGKSEQILKKALSDCKVYADDLLFWNPKDSKFIALGLPLRLRRTAISLIKDASIKDKFFKGKHILYSHKNFFNQSALEDYFLLDKIKIMNNQYISNDIPIYKFQKYLEKYLIGNNLISYKRKI